MLTTSIFHIWKERNSRIHSNDKNSKEQVWYLIEKDCIIMMSKLKTNKADKCDSSHSPNGHHTNCMMSLENYLSASKRGENSRSGAASYEPCTDHHFEAGAATEEPRTSEIREKASKSGAALAEPRPYISGKNQSNTKSHNQAKYFMANTNELSKNNQKVTSFIFDSGRSEERSLLPDLFMKDLSKNEFFLDNHSSKEPCKSEFSQRRSDEGCCFPTSNVKNKGKEQAQKNFNKEESVECMNNKFNKRIWKDDSVLSSVSCQSNREQKERVHPFGKKEGETSYDSSIILRKNGKKEKKLNWKPP